VASTSNQPDTRTIFRIVLIVVLAAVSLLLLWHLRGPLTWVFLAVFIAVALSAPVDFLTQYMRRGFAIALVFLGLVLIPVGLASVVLPPVVDSASSLAREAPNYADEAERFVKENDTLREFDRQYDLSGAIQEQAAQLPEKLPDAANTLADLGGGIASSLAAAITISVMAIFMLAGGPRWLDWLIKQQPAGRARRMRTVIDESMRAIGSYVIGALSVATLAGVMTFLVLLILGVPFAAPLAVMAGLFSLIPMVGATIAAIIIGIVTLFSDFPKDTIIWAVWAIVYQQVENALIQPQVQRRSVNIHPLVVIIAVLFGAALFGILGAILAVPIAATVQILVKEWWAYHCHSHYSPVKR
jgi:predicted PurR-regulated permease PerM